VLAGALACLLGACQVAAPPTAVPTRMATTVLIPTAIPPTRVPTTIPQPTPTPDVAGIQAQAARAQFEGKTSEAGVLLEQAAELLPASGAAQRAARFQRARLAYESADLSTAIGTLDALISDTQSLGTTDPALDSYYILLGRVHESAADPQRAAAGYQAALTAGSVLSPYLNLWLGNYYLALNTPISAVLPYREAVRGAPTVSIEFERREKLALALSRSGEFNAALAQYDEILARARVPAYRARMTWESALALQAGGQTRSAYARMQDLVANYETTPQALLALQALLEAQQPLDDLQRGRVNFHAKSYQAARDAFRRAIQSDTTRLDEIRLWAARNYAAMELPADALRNLDQIIATNPAKSARAAEALIVKAGVLLDAEDIKAARALLPAIQAGGARGRDAIRLARNFERMDAPEDALALYQLGNTQPDADVTLLERAREATLLSQLQRPAEAERALLQLLARPGLEAADASLLRFWLSKAQIAAGRVVTGEATLRALAADLPDTYAGVRAGQIIGGQNMLASGRAFTLPDRDDGQPEAEAWLRSWRGISETLDIRTMGSAVRIDARLLRGMALWRIGFEPEAADEFAGLINAFIEDPIALYQIAIGLRDLGAYRMSIRAADALMRRSPAQGMPSKLPVFLGRLVYPVYYGELVAESAHEQDVDPLLIFSIIRQESLFESFAESSAAAAGLMQVIPATGAEIQRELGWPQDFRTADLNKPYVSVRFGSYYLSKQRRLFDGNVPAMLAAYNGGPGNAIRWRKRGGDDPDAFVEAVSFEETRRYITAITVNRAVYARLYP
jgi:soluble lytic murein transglycosylase